MPSLDAYRVLTTDCRGYGGEQWQPGLSPPGAYSLVGAVELT